MGLFPTFTAHRQFARILRAWRRAKNIEKIVLKFSADYAQLDQKIFVHDSLSALTASMEEALGVFENEVVSEIRKSL